MRREPASWPSYRTLWRWHFYAGVLCIPMVLMLSATGLIYLFKPQIDDLIDYRYEHLAPPPHPRDATSEVRAALAAAPGSRLVAYELPRTPRSAARVIVLSDGRAIRTYVDPGSLRVLKTVDEEARFERVVFNLHGQLLLGNRGSVIVELLASWAIVMILTGLCLWWPRPRTGRQGLGGLLYPRLGASGRTFWRDLHAVGGLWVSAFALFLLISGLPWAYAWGNYLNEVRSLAAPARAAPDWQIGHVPARAEIAGATGGGAMAGMAGMGERPSAAGGSDPGAIDRITAVVAPLDLAYPVLITPPAPGSATWHARSDSQDRTRRTTLALSPDGRVLQRSDFEAHPLLDRLVGIGVAAHEGHLFGPLNMALNAATASTLAMLSVSALVLWLRRRPSGVLGAPPQLAHGPAPVGFVAVLALLAAALPLLGTSMLLVWLIERVVLRRLPAASRWLGLERQPAASAR